VQVTPITTSSLVSRSMLLIVEQRAQVVTGGLGSAPPSGASPIQWAAMSESKSERLMAQAGCWEGRVECGCGGVEDVVLVGTREVTPLEILRSAVGSSRRYYQVEGKLICEGCEQELIAREGEGSAD